jgi:hypothetical protein
MTRWNEEKRAFLGAKAAFHAHARQTAALFLVAALDLPALLDATRAEKKKAASRLARLIERERQRGIRRHWSYDLNRHIALKQVLDRLVAEIA